jgi:hypothetical protein
MQTMKSRKIPGDEATMKKSLRILTVLSVVASSILFVPSASAIGTLYSRSTGNGDVSCGTSGFFTIANNVVTGNTSCSGSVSIPDGVTSIADNAFENATYVETLDMTDSVQSIGNSAFYGAYELRSINIGNGVISIGNSAFIPAYKLTNLVIGNNVRTIGSYAFYGALILQQVFIPNSVTSIGREAFFFAQRLNTLSIGGNVTSLGIDAFALALRLSNFNYCGSGLTNANLISAGLITQSKACAATKPDAPTVITATSTSATTANVTFTSPSFNGGATITSYTATSSPGGITGSISQTGSGTIAMTGLTAETAYTFIVTATNSIGTSFASSPSNSITTITSITKSGAPVSVVATATGKRSATVSFAAPASNGGSVVTSYTATSTPGGITKTLTQATGGTFTFDGLQPGTSYTFAVTATNSIGTSAASISNSVTTTPLVVASLSSLSFADDGTGTGGKIVWSGKSIDAVLYTGSAAYYPGPYNYGAFSSGWNGRIRNLTPDTSYTVSLFVVSSDGVGESKSLTFKTSATLPALPGASSSTTSQADQMTTQLSKLNAWINENVFVEGEGDRMKTMFEKFDAATVLARSAYLKLPNSSVVRVSATSSTPLVCMVEGQLTVHSIAAGTCTISYTVSGHSKAPVTMVKDFVFKKFSK